MNDTLKNDKEVDLLSGLDKRRKIHQLVRLLRPGTGGFVQTLLNGTFKQFRIHVGQDVVYEDVGHEVLLAGLDKTAEVQRPPQKFKVVVRLNGHIELQNVNLIADAKL